MVALPYKFLRSRRNRILQPHRYAAPLAMWLSAWAELFEGIARETSDDRWLDLADALDDAAVILRTLA